MNQESISKCLERIGQAISTNNLRDLADCWEFPALILSILKGWIERVFSLGFAFGLTPG